MEYLVYLAKTIGMQPGKIITNPQICREFVLQAKKYARNKVAMFLKTVFLESEARFEMFTDKEFPLKTMYQFSKRVTL